MVTKPCYALECLKRTYFQGLKMTKMMLIIRYTLLFKRGLQLQMSLLDIIT